MSAAGEMDTAKYKHCVHELSMKWCALSHEEQEAFEIQAAFEVSQLDKLKEVPLSLKRGETSNLEKTVGKNSLKKISALRLQKNYDNFASHSIWSLPNQLGERSWLQTSMFCGNPFTIWFILRLV